MLDIEAIFRRYGVQVASSNDRHYRSGWVNTTCPFCTGNSNGQHLGWNIRQQYFSCFRCGFKHPYKVLRSFIPDEKDLAAILKDFKVSKINIRKEDAIRQANSLVLPKHRNLTGMARNYIRGRNFDPSRLANLWGLVSSHDPQFRKRIIAPITFNNRLVSYQTRDITDEAKLRYITCARELEVVHHKHIVYGYDQVPTDSVVIVEGITDVWRLGYGAVCTFGIKFTPQQVRLLGNAFTNRFVLYDQTEKQALRQGKKLAEQLSIYPGNTEYIEIKGVNAKKDPAQYTNLFASKLMQSLK